MSKPTQNRVQFLHTLRRLRARVFIAILALVVLTPVITAVYSITRAGESANTRAVAAIPTTLNFQARLTTASGAIVPDGDYNVDFKLYDHLTAGGQAQGTCSGNCLWEETRTGANKVTVKGGYLSVHLGSVTALPSTIWDQQLYLVMNIGGTGAPSWDGEMTPRIRLSSVPSAFRANTAATADALSKNTGTNTGSVNFANMTADRTFLLPDTGLATTASPGTICVFNGTASNCPAATGSAYYIQNTGGSGTPQAAANFNIQATNSGTDGTVAGILRGAVNGQTVDLLQFQNSGGTVLASVNAAGNLKVAASIDTQTATGLTVGGANATSVTITPNITASGTYNTNTFTASQLTFGAAALATVQSATNQDLVVNAQGTAAVRIQTTGVTAILVNTNSTVALGNTNNTSRLAISARGSATPTNGSSLRVLGGTVLDFGTASSGTAALNGANGFEQNTISSANTNVTTTNAPTVYIQGATKAGANMAIANSYGLQIDTASVAGGNGVTNAYGLSVQAPTGATNNYAAIFQGGNVGIGLTAPSSALDVSGTGKFSTSVLAPTLDAATAVALGIGTTNATGVNIGRAGVTTNIQGNTQVALSGTTGTTMVCQNASSLLSSCDATYLAPTAGNFIRNTTTQQTSANINIQSVAGSTALSVQGATSQKIASFIAAGGTELVTIQSTGVLNVSSIVSSYDSTGTTNAFVVRSGNSTSSGNTGDVTIKSGDATSGNSGNISIDAGTASGTKGTVSIGTTNASAVAIGQGSAVNISGTGVITLQSTVLGSGANVALSKSYTVGTGGVTAFDPVVLANDSGNTRVIDTTTARDPRIVGVATSTQGVVGGLVAVASTGSITINVDSGAVAIGDQLVTSTTSGRATVDNNATTGIIGIAMTAKAGGSNGTVTVSLGVVRGQTNPTFGGNVTIQGSTYTSTLDTATAVALNIGTTNATNITVGHNAGTFAVDGTNFDLSTAGVITLAGGQTSDITTQANQNLTVQANGTGTIVLNDTVTVAGTQTFSGVATDITTGSNEDLTVDANGTGKLVINDNTDITAGASFATQKATSDYTTAGSANDVAISTSSLVRLDTSGAAQTITGIAAGRDGQYLTLINIDAANAVTLSNNSGSSSDGNKIITGTGSDITIPVGGTLNLIYESTGTAVTSFWRVVGAASNAGGGANQQLSNLSGTVAINLSLLANDDNGKDLGSAANSWRTLYADTSVLTPNVDVATAGALGIGNSTATSVSICNSANCDTIQLGTNGDADTIQIGDATDTLSLTGTLDVIGVATVNQNVNFATNINTGSNNTQVTIGGGSGTFSLQTTNIDISNTGVISGLTGLSFASGAYNFDQSSSTGSFATGTGSVSLNGDVTVAAGKYLKLTGGNTASRPGSPTEGMLYYDTETDQLLIYNGGKWQADAREAVLVAASDSSPAAKAAADYIADGTADQVEIISAITEATTSTGNNLGSYKVYLFAGTYTIADTISLPNNVTLSGAGKGTLLQFANLGGVSKNMITNTITGGTGTGITIRDLKLDGNKATNSTDTFTGIYLDGLGHPTTNLAGATINNVTVQNFENNGIHIVNSANNIITGNTIQTNDDHGIFTNGANHDVISGNTITGNTLNGIYFNSTARDIVSNNFIGSNGNYGIRIETGNTNTITDNVLRSNTGSGSTSSVYLVNTDTNLITNNNITDTAGTGYAIDISDSGSDFNYLSNNTFSGTGATTINDQSNTPSPPDTIYAGQVDGSTNYLVQPAGTIELMKNTNVTGTLNISSNVDTNGSLTVGSADQFVVSNTGVVTAGTWNGTALTDTYVADALTISSSGSVDWTALTGYPGACAAGSAVSQIGDTLTCTAFATGTAGSYIQNQSASAQSASDFWISGSGRADTSFIAPTFTSAAALSLTSGANGDITINANGTGLLNLSDSVVVAANQYLKLTGGTTANRPSSPTEGMVYFDTDTDKLLIYSNGKWQGDRRDVTKTVAPSNAAQEIKDSADYVATGTSDQTIINTALTAAAGGRVYLFEGTFTTDDAISVPNNTVLAGSGAGTLIQFANIAGQTKHMIANTDTTTGTGVTVRDLKLDGNDGVNTTGSQTGIFFNGLGGYGTERRGALIQGVTAQNFLTQGIRLENSVQSIVTGSTANNNGGSGMFLQSSSHNTVTGNTASGNGVNGIGLNASSNNTITANTTSNNTQSGLSVASSSNHNAIDGNTSYANGGIGISLTTSSSHNTVSTNTSNANGSNGISLNAAHNNSLVGNTSSNNTLNGIGLTSANQNTLTGDTTSGNGTNGISLSGSSRNTITGSSISSNLAGGTQLVSTSDDNVISSGVLYDNGGSGAVSSITVTSSSNNQITGNRITDTAGTAYAINISNAGANTNYLAANTFSGTGATTINDAGTGTIYGGQIKDSSNGNYYIQPAGTIELMKNTNVTGTLSASTSVLAPVFDTATAVALGIGTANATNITVGHNAGTFAVDSTNFDLATNGVMTLAGGQTTDITTQANQNLTVVANGSGTVVLNDTVTVAGTLTFSNVATDITTGTNEDLTVDANGTGKLVINDNTDIASGASFATKKATSDYTTAGSANDVAISTSSLVRLDTSGAAQTITGIVAGRDGQYLTLINVDAALSVTISNLSGSSSAANQISTGTGQDIVLPFNGTITMVYDSGASLWRVVGGVSVTGGGANQQLSNLSGTVAINTALNPNADNSIDLGTTANSWRTLYADTSVLTSRVDRAAAATLNIGTVTANAISVSKSGVTTTVNGALTVSEATTLNGGFTLGDDGDTGSINTSDWDISATGDLSGIGSITANGNFLQSGATTFETGTGAISLNGDVTVTGAKHLTVGGTAGSGSVFTNNGATVATTLALTDFASGGSIGSAAATVDIYTSISVAQTTAGQTLTIPAPTANIAYGRIVYVSNIGTASFTLLGSTLSPGATATLMWTNKNGGAAWVYAGADGNAILNQSSADQSADFRISGTGRANTALQAPLMDTATNVALGIGTNNATNITIGRNAGTIAIDATNFDLTTGGVLTLLGGQTNDITTQSNQNLTLQANGTGTITLNDTTTAAGTVTFNGVATDITTGTNEDLTVTANGTGIVHVNDNITVTGNITLAEGADRTIANAARTTSGTGHNLTVAAGAANGANNAGGLLTLQGGAAVAGNANGGAVTIAGGAGFGTGTQGLVNLSTTAFTSSAVQTFSVAGVNTITAGLVDLYSTIPVNATTTTGIIVSVPDPAQSTVIGRVLYISARDSSLDFTLRLNAGSATPIDIAMKKNSTATLIWNGDEWTAAGASSSTDLQSAYNNTLTSAGGAELVLNAPGGNADGFTIRNNGTTPIVGGLLEVQTAIGSNLLSVNSNATEYASNGGAETAGGTSTTFPANTWDNAPGGGTDSRYITAGANVATGQASASIATTAAGHGAANRLSATLTPNLKYSVSYAIKADAASFTSLDTMFSFDGTATGTSMRECVAGAATYSTGTASQSGTTITGSGTTWTAAMVGQIFVFANGTTARITAFGSATSLTASVSQTVSSQNYALYNAGNTVTTAVWSRVTCTFLAPASGITSSNSIFIRQTDGTARTFYIDNLSVTVSADVNHAVDGSVDDSTNFTSNWTTFDADGGAGSSTISRDTSVLYDTSASAKAVTTAHVNEGIRNNMPISPQTSTQYLVTFYARASVAFSDITVGFLPAGGSTVPAAAQRCVDYNTQTVSTTTFTKITCIFTTPSSGITDPDVVIYQPTATARDIYIDALTVTLNTNTASNVQIGGANKGGPTTLLTLDRSANAPIAANNDAYLGSMYYDTVTGRIQCYEADGWGACGSAPDNIVTLTPEYTGAVLNGNGIGTLTADFCANSAALTVGTLCASGNSRQFYAWTSPQASEQVYSIYVSYKLPSTFKGFNSDDTINLTARTTNTTDGAVTYEAFRSTGSAISACGTETAVTNTTDGANFWSTKPVNGNEATSCSFGGGDNVIIKINVKAKNSAVVYVENLSFVFTNK